MKKNYWILSLRSYGNFLIYGTELQAKKALKDKSEAELFIIPGEKRLADLQDAHDRDFIRFELLRRKRMREAHPEEPAETWPALPPWKPKKVPEGASVSNLLTLDGRRSVAAPSVLGPRLGVKFSVTSVRLTINAFLDTGRTQHSKNRSMVGFVVAYCEENAIPYSVRAAFDQEGRRLGYEVKREEYL